MWFVQNLKEQYEDGQMSKLGDDERRELNDISLCLRIIMNQKGAGSQGRDEEFFLGFAVGFHPFGRTNCKQRGYKTMNPL